MIFTKNKDGVWAIRAMKYKKICGWKIYSRTRTFGAEVHKSNIRVKRWHNKYENSELYWKTTFVEKICLPSPIVLRYRLIKKEERTFGTPCIGIFVTLRIRSGLYSKICWFKNGLQLIALEWASKRVTGRTFRHWSHLVFPYTRVNRPKIIAFLIRFPYPTNRCLISRPRENQYLFFGRPFLINENNSIKY